jgi:prepilin-type processing-associated H-X9-DG protein
MFFCPSDDKEIYLRGDGRKVTNYSYSMRLGNLGYMGPSVASKKYEYSPRTLAKCQSPSTCAVMVDGRCKTSDSGILFNVYDWNHASMYMDARHNGGLNVLYADNHVKWFNLKSASPTEINQTFLWGGINTSPDWPW